MSMLRTIVGRVACGFGCLAYCATCASGDTTRLVAVGQVPDPPCVRRSPENPCRSEPAVTRLGGLSDLCLPHPGSMPRADAPFELWAITDRGPNGTIKTPAGKARTLLEPDFVPSLVRLKVERSATAAAGGTPARLAIAVEQILPLVSPTGSMLSGRPHPPTQRSSAAASGDLPIMDTGGKAPVEPSPDGVDTEGVVRLADGSFWVAEEYGPAVISAGADGRVRRRLLPQGSRAEAAELPTTDPLPARYAARQDNRGLEGLAASPDGSRLFAILQSPLECGMKNAAGGVVRLLVIDAADGRPLAEHLYPLDPETVDGKLCAIAAIDGTSAIVIEQGDGGRGRLYAVSLDRATDTLGRPDAAELGRGALERVGDPRARGIEPVAKRIVADLAGVLPAMRRDVYGEASEGESLKLEGIAILGDRRVAIVNDNDFGVPAKDGVMPKTCVWILETHAPLRVD